MIDGSREQEIYNELLELGLSEKYSRAGIYSITIEDKLVYVGKSKDMLIRIANHLKEIEVNQTSNKYRVLREAKTAGRRIQFDVLYYSPLLLEEEIDNDIGFKEGELIRSLNPPLNQQIPKIEDFRKYSVNKKAKYITLQEILEGS